MLQNNPKMISRLNSARIIGNKGLIKRKSEELKLTLYVLIQLHPMIFGSVRNLPFLLSCVKSFICSDKHTVWSPSRGNSCKGQQYEPDSHTRADSDRVVHHQRVYPLRRNLASALNEVAQDARTSLTSLQSSIRGDSVAGEESETKFTELND